MNPKTILKSIKKYQRFLISTHVNPDPDAICSELAMAMYLRQKGKSVLVVNEAKILPRFKFLPGTQHIKPYQKAMTVHCDAVIVLDCGELNRIGKVEKLIPKNAAVINIDHHITNDSFGHLNLVNPQSSSTTEVLYELFSGDHQFELTNNLALHLYAGIMTDTGSFRYENTSSRTHQIVAQLRKYSFSPTELYRRFYESISLSDLKEFTKVVSSFDSLDGGKVIVVELKKKIMAKFSNEFDLRDTVFKFLRSIKGAQVFVILSEENPRLTRINFRSSGQVDVAQIAHFFKGGGHHNASGCQIDKNMENARQDVLQQIRKVLNEYGRYSSYK